MVTRPASAPHGCFEPKAGVLATWDYLQFYALKNLYLTSPSSSGLPDGFTGEPEVAFINFFAILRVKL